MQLDQKFCRRSANSINFIYWFNSGRTPSQYRVAQRLGRSLLELGGNNAIIVDETADLKLAIPADSIWRSGHSGPTLHDHAAINYS